MPKNGFYHWTEWIPVVSSALAVGFLTAPLVTDVGRSYLAVCLIVLLLQGAVGVLGFYFHLAADLDGPAPALFENIVFGAPIMAPLLFPNLVLLAFLGLYVLDKRIPNCKVEWDDPAKPKTPEPAASDTHGVASEAPADERSGN